MVKSLDVPPDGVGLELATYEPDRRSEAWLKVKKDYLEGLGDSLDLVPIGAWHGMGRKTAFWSPILLAAYDPDDGTYQAVCKCMTGFTDAFYERLNERYGSPQGTRAGTHDVPVDLYEAGSLAPAVWWPPTEVWEIRAADVTASPTYPAAMDLAVPGRGLSLRFPRFIRVRDDRAPTTASSPADIARLYAKGAAT